MGPQKQCLPPFALHTTAAVDNIFAGPRLEGRCLHNGCGIGSDGIPRFSQRHFPTGEAFENIVSFPL